MPKIPESTSSLTFTVTENRDFALVGVLAARALQVQVRVLVVALAVLPLLETPSPWAADAMWSQRHDSRAVEPAENGPLPLIARKPGTLARVAPREGSHRTHDAPCHTQLTPRCPTAMPGGPRSSGDAGFL